MNVMFDVSVRWDVVFGALAVNCYLDLKEMLMNGFTSVVLFGAALLPVSWRTIPINTETWLRRINGSSEE